MLVSTRIRTRGLPERETKVLLVKKRCISFRNSLTPLYYWVRTFNFACMRRGDEIFSFLAKLTAFSQQLSGKLTISACLLIILLLVLDNCWNNLLLLYFPLLTRNAGEIFPSICMVKFRLLLFIFRWLKRNWISISVSLVEMFSPSGFKISWFSCWKWTY